MLLIDSIKICVVVNVVITCPKLIFLKGEIKRITKKESFK
jgi:hypothetical protein